jgi:hypothetical protein
MLAVGVGEGSTAVAVQRRSIGVRPSTVGPACHLGPDTSPVAALALSRFLPHSEDSVNAGTLRC